MRRTSSCCVARRHLRVAFFVHAPLASASTREAHMIQPRKSLDVLDASAASTDFRKAFPGSRKVYVEGPHGIRVPMREITLSGGDRKSTRLNSSHVKI